VLRLAPTHLRWDTRRQFTRRFRDPPGSKRRQTDYAVKQLRSKGFTRRPPNTPTFRNHGVSDDKLGQEKENLGAAENNAEDVRWEKTEDFKMDPTVTAATSKPYKLPGKIFKMLFAHQREGL
jgi:DNA excision repair protein ERCC-6-like